MLSTKVLINSLTLAALMVIMGAEFAIAIPKKEISQYMKSQYEEIRTPEKWKAFLESNKNLFPTPTSSAAITVNVLKEEIKVNNETFTLGSGYRQVFVKANPDRVKTILSRPDIFQQLYGLDKESAPASELQPGQKLPETFEANIYKRLPSVLPDQEYTLKYTAEQKENIWFQTVTLVEDKTEFALRETLVVVEPTAEGVVFREIGKVYPLSWVVRAMGPQLRSIMKDELTKMSKPFICVAESSEPITKDLAAKCVSAAK